jgi:hypothetical protein
VKRVIALVVVLSAAQPGQSQPPRDPSLLSPALSATATIRGRVVAADSAEPIRNASVKLDDEADAPAVLSDAEGRFTLTRVPAGRHMLSVAKTGYATTVYFGGRQRPIAVSQGAVFNAADIRLPKGAAIAGRVLDDLGAAFPLMAVVAERREHLSLDATKTTVETDDTGAYRLFGLAAGRYVVATAGGRAMRTAAPIPAGLPAAGSMKYYPNDTTEERAQVIVLAAGDEVSGIDFTRTLPVLPPQPPPRVSASGVIRGRVVRADGVPLRRARVQLASADNLFTPYVVPTDDDGRYEVRGLRAGFYVLSAAALGSQPVARGQRRPRERGELITLAAGATLDGVDLTLARASSISGRVVDEFGDPVANANVRVEQIVSTKGRSVLASVGGMASRPTDDYGRYRIFGLQPGRYVVGAVVGEAVPGWPTADLPGYARTYYPATPVPAESQALEVPAGDDLFNVDIALVRGRSGRISGTVYDAAGAPLDGAVMLSASRRSGAIALAPLRCRTTREGAFEFPNLAPGEYVLQAAKSARDVSSEGEFAHAFVTLDGNDVAGVVLRMRPGSSIAGRIVVDSGDVPSPSFDQFEFSPIMADADLVSLADNAPARADIHEDGTFEMQGVYGPRRLLLAAAPDGWMLEAVRVNGRDATDEPLVFGTPEQSLQHVEIVITSRHTELAGTVVDDHNRPFADALVIALPTDRALWYPSSRFIARAKPDMSGAFVVSSLPPGNYYVAALDRSGDVVDDDSLQNPEFLEEAVANATAVTLGKGERATLRISAR